MLSISSTVDMDMDMNMDEDMDMDEDVDMDEDMDMDEDKCIGSHGSSDLCCVFSAASSSDAS